jgi:hypothetical protein
LGRWACNAKLFDRVVTFLPNIERRFKALIDDLVTVTQPQVDTAHGLLRELVGGQIRLHPASDGTDRFLTAEVSGDYTGLMKLACGPQILSNPAHRHQHRRSDSYYARRTN